MVCYCPLSVLSVPESILNEGQLHLAAIFQLSSRCHGDPVVSWWACQESKRESGGGGANAARGSGVRTGSERKARGQGQGNVTEERTAWSRVVMLCSHLINQPFRKHALCSSGPNTADSPLCCLSTTLYELHRFGFWNNYSSLLSAPGSSPFPPPALTASPLIWCQPQGIVLDLGMFNIQHRKTSFTKDNHTGPLPNPDI